MSGELGWLVEEVAHSMEEFKQSLEWLRRLDTLFFNETTTLLI